MRVYVPSFVCRTMPSSYCSTTSPGEVSISDGEVDGADYLLSSTIRLDEAFFQILGEFLRNYRYFS